MSAPTSRRATTDGSTRTAWASGLSLFAAIMLFLQGGFQILEGIVRLADDTFFVPHNGYVYKFDTTVWGWILLILGVISILVGAAILAEATVGYVLGIVVVTLSALSSFAFLPYYPIWSLLVIGIGVAVIWALCVMMGRDRVTE
jgi:hypothetical protein